MKPILMWTVFIAGALSPAGLMGCGDFETTPPTAAFLPEPPLAVAGSDLVVRESERAELDGTATFDPDDDLVAVEWIQLQGPVVSLADENSPRTHFDAPEVLGNDDTVVLEFRLTAFDASGLSDADEVSVLVFDSNQRPLVFTDAEQNAPALSSVALRAEECGSSGCAVSTDVDGTIVSYRWTQIAGPSATLPSISGFATNAILPDVTRPERLLFQVEITDNEGKSAAATTAVNVTPVAAALALVEPLPPAEVTAGAPWPLITVAIHNASAQRIDEGPPAGLTLNLNLTQGTGVLSGPGDATASSGLAEFAGLSYDTAEPGIEITVQETTQSLELTFDLDVLAP